MPNSIIKILQNVYTTLPSQHWVQCPTNQNGTTQQTFSSPSCFLSSSSHLPKLFPSIFLPHLLPLPTLSISIHTVLNWKCCASRVMLGKWHHPQWESKQTVWGWCWGRGGPVTGIETQPSHNTVKQSCRSSRWDTKLKLHIQRGISKEW